MKEFSASKVKIIIIIRESIIQFCKSFTSLTLLLNFDGERLIIFKEVNSPLYGIYFSLEFDFKNFAAENTR